MATKATETTTRRRRRTAKAKAPARIERRRPGRPTKLTHELGEEIIQLISAGNYIETAAKACGISKQRIYDWSAKGAEYDDATEEELDALNDEQLLYAWFRDAINRSEGRAEAMLLVRARQGRTGQNVENGVGAWQAYMTILERRFPDRWARRQPLEVTAKVEASVVEKPLVEGSPEYVEAMAAFGMPAAFAVAAGPEAVLPPESA